MNEEEVLLAAASRPSAVIVHRNTVRAQAWDSSLMLNETTLALQWPTTVPSLLLPEMLHPPPRSADPALNYDSFQIVSQARTFLNIFSGGVINDSSESATFLANPSVTTGIHAAARYTDFIQSSPDRSYTNPDTVFESWTTGLQLDATFQHQSSTNIAVANMTNVERLRHWISFDNTTSNLYVAHIGNPSYTLSLTLLIEKIGSDQFVIFYINPVHYHPADALEFSRTVSTVEVMNTIDLVIFPLVSTALPSQENVIRAADTLHFVRPEYNGVAPFHFFTAAALEVSITPGLQIAPLVPVDDGSGGAGGSSGGGVSSDTGNSLVLGADGLPFLRQPTIGKGGIITSDGTDQAGLLRGQDSQILIADNASLLGLRWTYLSDLGGSASGGDASTLVATAAGRWLFTASDGTTTAIEPVAGVIPFSSSTSTLTSTNVQAAIDELATGGGISSAATTTYSRTLSGLNSITVQAAIDELSATIGSSTGGAGAVSTDAGNLLYVSTNDGGVMLDISRLPYNPPSVSTTADNIISTSTDGGAFLSIATLPARVSVDTGNIISSGTDGGSLLELSTLPAVISSDPLNIIILGSSGGCFLSHAMLQYVSLTPTNLISNNDGAYIDDAVIRSVVDPSVSSDAGNQLVAGTDGGALLITSSLRSSLQPNILAAQADGLQVDPAAVASSDAQNRISIGSDGGLILDTATLVSTDTGNKVVVGSDGLFSVTTPTLVSANAENMLSIDASDSGLLVALSQNIPNVLTRGTDGGVRMLPATSISSDSNNAITTGSDGLLFSVAPPTVGGSNATSVVGGILDMSVANTQYGRLEINGSTDLILVNLVTGNRYTLDVLSLGGLGSINFNGANYVVLEGAYSTTMENVLRIECVSPTVAYIWVYQKP